MKGHHAASKQVLRIVSGASRYIGLKVCRPILQYRWEWQMEGYRANRRLLMPPDRAVIGRPPAACKTTWSLAVNETRQSNTSFHNAVRCSSPCRRLDRRSTCDEAAKYAILHSAAFKTSPLISQLPTTSCRVAPASGCMFVSGPRSSKTLHSFDYRSPC